MPCPLLCYFSYPWQCLSDGRSDIPSATAWPLERKTAEGKHQLLNGCHGKYKFTWWLWAVPFHSNLLSLTLSWMCILSVKSSHFVSAFPLFWLTHENSKLCVRLNGCFMCLPTAKNMKWFTEALKIIEYRIVYFFLYCKRVIFICYFIFLFRVAGTLEKKIKSTTYPIIILGT